MTVICEARRRCSQTLELWDGSIVRQKRVTSPILHSSDNPTFLEIGHGRGGTGGQWGPAGPASPIRVYN